MKLFEKAKFEHLVMEKDDYLIQISSNGVCLTKMVGSGWEKDCDVEFTWDEIYQMKEAL